MHYYVHELIDHSFTNKSNRLRCVPASNSQHKMLIIEQKKPFFAFYSFMLPSGFVSANGYESARSYHKIYGFKASSINLPIQLDKNLNVVMCI